VAFALREVMVGREAQDDLANDLLRGAREIAEYVGETEKRLRMLIASYGFPCRRQGGFIISRKSWIAGYYAEPDPPRFETAESELAPVNGGPPVTDRVCAYCGEPFAWVRQGQGRPPKFYPQHRQSHHRVAAAHARHKAKS
jgi:hypothetical protein